MNKMLKKFKHLLGIVLIGTIFFAVPAFAAGLTVEFETDPLFGETNFVPGNDVTRYIRVENTSGTTRPITIEFIDYSDDDGLGTQLTLLIEENSTPLYTGTVADFYYNQGEYYLSDLATGNNTQYNLTISFQPSAGNDYQKKMLGFDIIAGSEGEESVSSGGGGVVLPRGLSIYNEGDVSVATTSVVISWNTSYDSTSQVIYSLEGGNRTLDLSSLPGYGYDFAAPDPEDTDKVRNHSVTITGLTPGETYYYRCVSHASPATIGQEHSFTTLALTETVDTSDEPQGDSEEESLGTGEEGLAPDTGGTETASGTGEGTGTSEVVTSEGEEGLTGDLVDIVEDLIDPSDPVTTDEEDGNNLGANLMDFVRNIPWWVMVIVAFILFFLALLTRRKKQNKK
jgi:hypothetical protein